MNSPINHKLPDGVKLHEVIYSKVSDLFIYGNVIIVETHEGIHLSYKNGFSLLVKVLNILGSKPFVFIANRIDSYSIKPTDYKYLNKVPTLRGIAVVAYSEMTKANAVLETKFCRKPFSVFENTYDAFVWAQSLINPMVTLSS